MISTTCLRHRFVRVIAALAIVALVAIGRPALAAVTVAIDGQPLYLNPGPIERAGRVFVPLRGIFERLGASVVYASGQINAQRGRTNVSLTIGSQQATVDGQPQVLDVAPFIVGATTYVPLRFVAQSLGAIVNYNDSTQLVAITAPRGGGAPPPYPPPPPNPPPTYPVQLSARQPQPDSFTQNRFAAITAQFSRPVDPYSVRVYLDGNEVTSRSNVSREGFSYSPPAPLSIGRHGVRVTGVGRDGARFNTAWAFTTTSGSQPPQPVPSVRLTNQQPSPQNTVDNRFAVISANFAPQADGASVRVRLDGNDVTGRAGVWPGGFSYKPPAPLAFGSHTVRVTGRSRSGAGFDYSWSFTVRRSGGPISLSIGSPDQSMPVGLSFVVAGNTVPNARIAVTAGGGGSATGQFSGNTTAGPKGNFQISVVLSQMMGQQAVTVKITATDPSSGQTAQQTLRLRLR